jgi:hypothetical protein
MTPRAMPAIAIGVSGHRVPPKLPEASEAPVRSVIDRMFAAVAAAASASATEPARHERPVAIVSSLAEGSDRIVAAAGLAAGFALEVVLPFPRAEYARDFETAASQREFEELLARAAEVIELAGNTAERPRAYEAAGLLMLEKIDLLIAIWDGESAAGIGGTAQIVERAVESGILVVWIEPSRPDNIHLSWPARPTVDAAQPDDIFRKADLAAVMQAIGKILNPPG